MRNPHDCHSAIASDVSLAANGAITSPAIASRSALWGWGAPTSAPHQLPHHRLQDAAVAEVVHVHGRVEPGHGAERQRGSVLPARAQHHRLPGPELAFE